MDAHVSQYYQDRSFYGGAQGILFCGQYSGQGDAYRSYIRFSLRNLNLLMTPRRQAFLRLFIYRNEIPGRAIEYEAGLVSARWTAQNLSWRSQPDYYTDHWVRFLVPAGWLGFMLVDVTRLIAHWANGEHPNYGLVIKGDEFSTSFIAFHGGKYPYRNTVPAILVEGD